jgi:A/G-specific adenine glycosylase
MAWYRRTARDLPWRRSRDPYHVWVSEIMLQQTQVATVVDYFERFIAMYPTVADLAAADEADVLRQWEGLGYYRRARQLRKAAQVIVDEHGGEMPSDVDLVHALPGIGRYTAGAILSIAHDVRLPIVEANTVRLYARLMADRGDMTNSAGQKRLWEFAETILPRLGAGQFNQALMELGSEICRPREPLCRDCPVVGLCPTFAAGLQEKIPRAKKRPKVTAVREAAVVVRKGPRVLVRLRGDKERWAGMWDFPRFEITAHNGAALRRELTKKVAQQTGVTAESSGVLTTIQHSVTRYRITLECHTAKHIRSKRQANSNLQWCTPAELDNLPLSVTARKIAKLLQAQV